MLFDTVPMRRNPIRPPRWGAFPECEGRRAPPASEYDKSGTVRCRFLRSGLLIARDDILSLRPARPVSWRTSIDSVEATFPASPRFLKADEATCREQSSQHKRSVLPSEVAGSRVFLTIDGSQGRPARSTDLPFLKRNV